MVTIGDRRRSQYDQATPAGVWALKGMMTKTGIAVTTIDVTTSMSKMSHQGHRRGELDLILYIMSDGYTGPQVPPGVTVEAIIAVELTTGGSNIFIAFAVSFQIHFHRFVFRWKPQ